MSCVTGLTCLLGGACCRCLGALSIGDVQSVQLAASSWLSDGLAGWVVRDVVSIDDVVVPVALALLECLTLEAESAFPATRLGRVLGKWKLTIVVVPGAEQVDSLDIGGSTEGEVKLDSGHYDN